MAGKFFQHLQYLSEGFINFLLSILFILFYPILLALQLLHKLLFLLLRSCNSRFDKQISFDRFFSPTGITYLHAHILFLFFLSSHLGFYFHSSSFVPPSVPSFAVRNVKKYQGTPWNLTDYTNKAARWNSQFSEVRYHVLCGVLAQHVIGCSIFDYHFPDLHWKPVGDLWKQFQITDWDTDIFHFQYPNQVSSIHFIDVARFRGSHPTSNIISILSFNFPIESFSFREFQQ